MAATTAAVVAVGHALLCSRSGSWQLVLLLSAGYAPLERWLGQQCIVCFAD
jgi:hypothetical protein